MNASRREFLASLGAAAPAFAAQGKSKPNVLFIAIDDLNDWIGCLGGHPQVKTPNMDRLAKRGVLFTRAYCAAPVCNPSRAALLTGIRPSTSGVYENRQPMRKSAVLADAVTIQQHFMANGYRVAGGGKIFHNAFNDKASWHEWITEPPNPSPAKVPANGIPNTAHFDWGAVDGDDDSMGDWKIANWAASELQKKHDKPFFLAPGFIRPHLPWYAPKKYFDMYPLESIVLPKVKEDDLDDIPQVGRHLATRSGDHKKVIEYGQWKQAVQGYLASITFTDACVGRVIDALDKSEYRDNTVVALWSDHGWHLGEKLHWRKFALWEEATRNPMMWVVPGMTKPGGQCHRTVDYMNIYPTLVELCGLSRKDGLEGVSMAPLLKDPAAKWDRPALTTYQRGNHSVRSERWRYIRYHDGSEELYDHNSDEMEWNNLAGRPEHAKVKQELARWLPKVDAPDAPQVGPVKKG